MFHNRKTTLLIVAVFLVSLGLVVSPTMAFAEKPNKCPCKYTSEKIVRDSYKFDIWDVEIFGDGGDLHLWTILTACDGSGDNVIYKVDKTLLGPDYLQTYYQCQVQGIDGFVLVNFYEIIPAGEPMPDWYEACQDELRDAGNDLFDLWGPPTEFCE